MRYLVFDKASMSFCKMFRYLKQLFDVQILIKRLPSFSVPKITVTRYVYKVAVNMVNQKSLMKNARTLMNIEEWDVYTSHTFALK